MIHDYLNTKHATLKKKTIQDTKKKIIHYALIVKFSGDVSWKAADVFFLSILSQILFNNWTVGRAFP